MVVNELPEVMLEWDYIKNAEAGLAPDAISTGSQKHAWWVGKTCGHSWRTPIRDRIKGCSGCPICSNKQVLIGFNDLATTNPDVAEQWHKTENFPLTPQQVTKGSSKKVWWTGRDCGHSWRTAINGRVARSSGCPYCSNKKVLAGYNDLATTNPETSIQWHPVKNAPLTAKEVTKASQKRVWWVCDQGHEVECTVVDRVHLNGRCQVCSGRRVQTGYNDFVTLMPELAKQWHPTKNILNPHSISLNANENIWWVCDQGHEWKTALPNRTRAKKATGCPYCSNQKTQSGVNDFQTTYPELATQWHPTKNDTTPDQVNAGTHKKVWWMCSTGHEFQQSVSMRTRQSGLCPVCIGQHIQVGINDFASQFPDMVDEWDFDDNIKLPTEIAKRSKYIAGWKCSKGHTWKARVADRTRPDHNNRTGCPECVASQYVSRGEQELYDFLAINIDAPLRQTYRGLRTQGIYELDIYCPSKNIAIEFNGLYWHSEKFKDTEYHQRKFQECKAQGITLIQVWEDDWNLRKDIVQQMLLHKFGATTSKRVFARKCTVVNVKISEAKAFLDTTHIQGFVNGSWSIGLHYNDELVAVGAFRKRPSGDIELLRYATSQHVVGGLGKILSAVQKNYPNSCIVTFADHTISDGSMYETMGFVNEKEIAPDYSYFIGDIRMHKFNFRKQRFQEDEALLYEDGKTERELAQLNNLLRIYDAGKTRYVLAALNS